MHTKRYISISNERVVHKPKTYVLAEYYTARQRGLGYV